MAYKMMMSLNTLVHSTEYPKRDLKINIVEIVIAILPTRGLTVENVG